MLSRKELAAGWRTLGLEPGSKVLVHTSLRSLGVVEPGPTGAPGSDASAAANTVIDSLLDVLGPAGALLAPTLTGSEELSAANLPRFDPAVTPCWTGRLPETLRQRPGAVRSVHPTHSVAGLGAELDDLLGGHRFSITPCDEWSPYGRLAARDDGYVLLVGVGHNNSTLFHHAEELAGVTYHMQPGLVPAIICAGATHCTRHVMLHRYGTAREFDRLEPVLRERGVQRDGQVGQAAVRLVHARSMVQLVLRALAADANILCAREL